MCYISDLKPGEHFLVRNKRGVWMKTSVEFRWILNENGMQAFRCMSNLNDIQDRGYLCIDVDTGEPFVFTAGEKSKLAVCQL